MTRGTCKGKPGEHGEPPANGCDAPNSAAKIRNILQDSQHPEEDLMLGRSKRVLFSAFKMARKSGDVKKVADGDSMVDEARLLAPLPLQ